MERRSGEYSSHNVWALARSVAGGVHVRHVLILNFKGVT